jgi:hypothetical protein
MACGGLTFTTTSAALATNAKPPAMIIPNSSFERNIGSPFGLRGLWEHVVIQRAIKHGGSKRSREISRPAR